MNFKEIPLSLGWQRLEQRADTPATYVYVMDRPVGRLKGSSDILYIGNTEGSISKRFAQETIPSTALGEYKQGSKTAPQQTNIRLRYLYREMGGPNSITVWYVDQLEIPFPEDLDAHLEELLTWNRKHFLELHYKIKEEGHDMLDLEKYLLVKYASEHLELPPWNNRF